MLPQNRTTYSCVLTFQLWLQLSKLVEIPIQCPEKVIDQYGLMVRADGSHSGSPRFEPQQTQNTSSNLRSASMSMCTLCDNSEVRSWPCTIINMCGLDLF